MTLLLLLRENSGSSGAGGVPGASTVPKVHTRQRYLSRMRRPYGAKTYDHIRPQPGNK